MDLLSRDNPIMDICALMGVSRAGYYKWKNRGPSPRDTKREEIVALVKQVHAAHPTHGYRWTAAYIRINMQVIISQRQLRLQVLQVSWCQSRDQAPGTL